MPTDAQIMTFAYMLEDLIQIGLKASQKEIAFGPPCGELTKTVLRTGSRALAKKMLSQPSYEFRLNGAGLKLFVSTYNGVTALVAGDQFGRYPESGPALNKALKDNGYQ